MTKQQSFKQRVRERLNKTGERYTTARSQLLAKSAKRSIATDVAGAFPGVFPGYEQFGGVQSDTSVLCNVYAYSGVVNPLDGKPFTEATVSGLCGGLGFMYAVFEYKGYDPMLTITMRSKTMPETFLAPIADRTGVSSEVSQTTSAKVARKALDEAIEAKRPPMCVVDTALLPHYGLPSQIVGMYPTYVAVAGVDGEDVWVDDRGVAPVRLSMEQFTKARGGYKKAKHLLVTVTQQQRPQDADTFIGVLKEAISDTVRALEDGDVGVPDSFKVNCGFFGMEKFRALLVDPKNRKGWHKVFASGSAAVAGFQRLHDCVQYEYTAPLAGRAFYAEFLDEVAKKAKWSALSSAAKLFRNSAGAWGRVIEAVTSVEDDDVRKIFQLSERRGELIDADRTHVTDELLAIYNEMQLLAANCNVNEKTTLPVYERVSEIIAEIIDIEQQAVEALKVALTK